MPRCACDSGSASVCALEVQLRNHSGVQGYAATVASWCHRLLALIAIAARSAARRRGPYGSRSAPQLLCSCACEQRDHDVGVLVRCFFAAVSRSAACASVSDFDGRPAVPRGTSQSSATLRHRRSARAPDPASDAERRRDVSADPLPKPTLIYIKRRAAPGRRSACPASLRPLRGDTSRCLADF